MTKRIITDELLAQWEKLAIEDRLNAPVVVPQLIAEARRLQRELAEYENDPFKWLRLHRDIPCGQERKGNGQ